jgi:hypothetical protein
MANVGNVDRDFGTAANGPAATYSEMEPDSDLAAARGISLGVVLGTVVWASLGLGIWLLVHS